MFDLGFSELLLIGVVALIVLGPERLPKAARLAGLWMRRARAQWHSVRSELERDLAAEELRRSLQATRQGMREIDASLREAEHSIRADLDAIDTAGREPPHLHQHDPVPDTDAHPLADAADATAITVHGDPASEQPAIAIHTPDSFPDPHDHRT